MTLSIVLYEHDTWFLIFRGKQSTVCKEYFDVEEINKQESGHKYNREFHNLNSSNSIIKRFSAYEAQLDKIKCRKMLLDLKFSQWCL